MRNSPALPKPLQRPHPPIIIGGHGPKRTPALAARFGAELNVPFAPVEVCKAMFDRADKACATVGRDPATLVRSTAQVLCCGRDEAEVTRRADAIGREVDELRTNGLAGTPAEVVDKIATYAALGVSRVYLQVLDLSDLDQIELVATEVMGRLPG